MTVTDDANSRRGLQFSVQTVLISIFVVALVLGWSVDRARLQRQLTRTTEIARFGKLKLFDDLRCPDVIGMQVAEFPEVERFADDMFDESHLPPLWRRVGEDYEGKECIGYYFQTAELEEGEGQPGFYVLTIDRRIVLVEAKVVLW